MCPELRYEHMAHSAVHDADTKHYIRSLVDQTCSHLLEDMARCIGWHRIEKNRSRHASSYQEMSRGGKTSCALQRGSLRLAHDANIISNRLM